MYGENAKKGHLYYLKNTARTGQVCIYLGKDTEGKYYFYELRAFAVTKLTDHYLYWQDFGCLATEVKKDVRNVVQTSCKKYSIQCIMDKEIYEIEIQGLEESELRTWYLSSLMRDNTLPKLVQGKEKKVMWTKIDKSIEEFLLNKGNKEIEVYNKESKRLGLYEAKECQAKFKGTTVIGWDYGDDTYFMQIDK